MTNDTPTPRKAANGPAFPVAGQIDVTGMVHDFAPGMTMRQWYKGQALIGLVIATENPNQPLGWSVELVASAAGDYADAMLAEDAKEERNG